MAEELDTAEALLDASQYEEAYTLLDSIDGSKYAQRSRMQARYALLYTRALYKNYIVSPSDSLISIAVDYAEEHGDDEDKFYAYLYQGIVRYELNDYSNSSVSFIRALANADDIKDAYSKGQMYTYLALVNGVQLCSDEDYYAQKAYQTYLDGGLESYLANALSIMASAKLNKLEFDTALVLLNNSIEEAEKTENIFALQEAMSLKATYYTLVDSVKEAVPLYNKLKNDLSYTNQLKDLCNLAYINAKNHNINECLDYISLARNACTTKNDTIQYLTKAIWVFDCLGDNAKSSLLKDSLLVYEDQLLAECGVHTSLAYQRDYSEWQTMVAKNKSLQKSRIIVLLSLSLLILLLLFFLYYREKKNQLIIQIEKVERLQAQLAIQSKENVAKLLLIKSSSVVNELKEKARGKSLPHIDWETLDKLFSENIPYFEQSLKELTSLSEIEWRVCMLIKLDFAPGDIAVLLNRTAGAISVIRSRLYNKVFRTKGRPGDWDTFIEKL